MVRIVHYLLARCRCDAFKNISAKFKPVCGGEFHWENGRGGVKTVEGAPILCVCLSPIHLSVLNEGALYCVMSTPMFVSIVNNVCRLQPAARPTCRLESVQTAGLACQTSHILESNRPVVF